jgi:hypothetical protein
MLERGLFILPSFFKKKILNLLPAPLLLLEDIVCFQSVGRNDTIRDFCHTLIAVCLRVALLRINILSVSSVLKLPKN